eukprot:GHVT01090714.1.p1 GENE.GHVT01090714.1~~GHVT01090714.1.p1  ORF type:complete len:686 (-),score=113.67 GHVT01090714.1:708-2765(-)
MEVVRTFEIDSNRLQVSDKTKREYEDLRRAIKKYNRGNHGKTLFKSSLLMLKDSEENNYLEPFARVDDSDELVGKTVNAAVVTRFLENDMTAADFQVHLGIVPKDKADTLEDSESVQFPLGQLSIANANFRDEQPLLEMSVKLGKDQLPIKVTKDVFARLKACSENIKLKASSENITEWSQFTDACEGELLLQTKKQKFLGTADYSKFNVRRIKAADLLIFEERSCPNPIRFIMRASAVEKTSDINWGLLKKKITNSLINQPTPVNVFIDLHRQLCSIDDKVVKNRISFDPMNECKWPQDLKRPKFAAQSIPLQNAPSWLYELACHIYDRGVFENPFAVEQHSAGSITVSANESSFPIDGMIVSDVLRELRGREASNCYDAQRHQITHMCSNLKLQDFRSRVRMDEVCEFESLAPPACWDSLVPESSDEEMDATDEADAKKAKSKKKKTKTKPKDEEKETKPKDEEKETKPKDEEKETKQKKKKEETNQKKKKEEPNQKKKKKEDTNQVKKNKVELGKKPPGTNLDSSSKDSRDSKRGKEATDSNSPISEPTAFFQPHVVVPVVLSAVLVTAGCGVGCVLLVRRARNKGKAAKNKKNEKKQKRKSIVKFTSKERNCSARKVVDQNTQALTTLAPPVTQPDGRAVTQSDCRAVTQPDCRAVTQSDSRAVTQPDCRTVTQSVTQSDV